MRLNATSNYENKFVYKIEKTDSFRKDFSDFLKIIGFEEKTIDNFNKIFFPLNNQKREINVFEVRDKLYKFNNNDFHIDLYFGYRKIIIKINMLNKKRGDFIKKIFNEFDWIVEEQKELRYKVNCLSDFIRVGDLNFVRRKNKRLNEFKTEFLLPENIFNFLNRKGFFLDKLICDLNVYDKIILNKKNLNSNDFVCIIYDLKYLDKKISFDLDEIIKENAIKDFLKRIKLDNGKIELRYLIVNL